jgi:anthranilate synthase component 1
MRAIGRFLKLCKHHDLIPLCREVVADLETPLSAFMKLCHAESSSFLLENAEGRERMTGYSFLGCRPIATLVCSNGKTRIYRGKEATTTLEVGLSAKRWKDMPGHPGDPLDHLRELLRGFNTAWPLLLRGESHSLTAEPLSSDGAPGFLGGAVGYLGYDAVRTWERLLSPPPDHLGLPDAVFMVPQVVVTFDRLRHRLLLTVMVQPGSRPEAAFWEAVVLMEGVLGRLRGSLPNGRCPKKRKCGQRVLPQMSAQQFMAAVDRIKEYIAAGDAFQVVLSQRLEVRQVQARPLDIYRALRVINPSPYMFYLSFGDVKLVGASPEMMVRVEGESVEVRPIAGTAPRGTSAEEDLRREESLLRDEKERAEHLMLVDLARNDLGRVCAYGTVEVVDLMRVERYSHVMHLVSEVRGRLAPGQDAASALRACFPAGTLSGAPKVRAMQIIDEVEPTRRGPYGGAVGYLSFSGSLDSCITIRTVLLKGRRAFVQAGAGIVADSDPEREYQETMHKIQAVLRALEMAEEGLP